MVHSKCRGELYQYKGGQEKRVYVPDENVSWDVELKDYNPTDFTAPFVLSAPWADPELDGNFSPQWNALDGKVNRASHEGLYIVSSEGRPLNIRGRTGLAGRGVLGKWGPNHAADPIVTRWLRQDGDIVVHPESGKKVLEFVSIQRRDTGDWAIPGGMVDPGENVSATVKREFMEEALDSTGAAKDNVESLSAMVEHFFKGGEVVYRGYVDDPRNTDNAWMETVAFNFHDGTGEEVGQLPLQAGDDAGAIKWMKLSSEVNLYASHKEFVEKVVQKLEAHW